MRASTRAVRVAVAAVAALALTAGINPPASLADQPAEATVASAARNPLTAGPLGVYRGDQDGVYPAYAKASGTKKQLLASMALQPRMRWFGQWIPTKDIGPKVRDHIRGVQAGDPDVIVPMAVFRLWPRTEAAKHRPLSAKEQRQYKRWVDKAAAAIGTSRVVMVLEPDLPVALTGWKPAVRQKLTKYAAKRFGALRNTTVYLDAGDSDWLPIDEAAAMLRRSGIAHVRGFALGATHYADLAEGVRYAGALSQRLAASGLPGKRAVLDTADNGRPFTWLEYWAAHPKGDFDNAEVCRDRAERRCVTLGVPPTTDVAAVQWGLDASTRTTAAQHVDAYLWFGRPWLHRQASPFVMKRALQVARTTPWA